MTVSHRHSGRQGGGRRGKRRRVLRFLRTCLMVLLRQEARHGYALLSDLAQFGFVVDRLDPSLVYRSLREMETDGWVRSEWDEVSQGPKRRIYALTDTGEAQMDHFMDELKRTREDIDVLINLYEQS